MFGLFNDKNPECPQCGRETTYTGACAPYAAYRCDYCIRENEKEKTEKARRKIMEDRITNLEARLAEMKDMLRDTV